jgi:hypothetical protein
VMLRYPSKFRPASAVSGATTYISNGYRIYVWITVGSYTITF